MLERYEKYRGEDVSIGICPHCNSIIKYGIRHISYKVEIAESFRHGNILFMCLNCFKEVEYTLEDLDKRIEEYFEGYNSEDLVNEKNYKIEY